jgi:hypothetical protein
VVILSLFLKIFLNIILYSFHIITKLLPITQKCQIVTIYFQHYYVCFKTFNKVDENLTLIAKNFNKILGLNECH